MAAPVVVNGGFETGDSTGWVEQGYDYDQWCICWETAPEGLCFWHCEEGGGM